MTLSPSDAVASMNQNERRDSRSPHSDSHGLLDRLDVGVFCLDEEGRIVSSNSAFARLLALDSRTPGRGTAFSSLLATSEDVAVFAGTIERDERVRGVDLRFKRGEASTWMRLTAARAKQSDGRVLLEGILEDVDRFKRSEQALVEEREAALSGTRAKSEFLASMSHEIRTPMNGVIGMTDLLLETELDTEQREFAYTIRSSGRALLTLINDILDFSKIEAGRLELEDAPFRLRTLVEDVRRSLAPLADQKGLALGASIDPETPDDLIGDPSRLRQVLLNLVGNAIKFTSKGAVTMRMNGRVTDRDRVRLRFAVTDSGVGIDEEQRRRIFTPFAQGDRSTTRRFGGTGLGLTISSRIVQLMGGDLSVESQPGRGSTFAFEIELKPAEACAESPRIAPSELNGVSVLIVEDDTTTCRQLSEMVALWNMRCVTASDPGAALRAIQGARAMGEPFGVALIDIHLPDMDGFELARRIRAEALHDATAVVLITAAGVRGDAGRCRELGLAGYLTKPIEAQLLLEVFRSVLSRRVHGALVTRHELLSRSTPLKILLAEDNPVNRRVASKHLERAGHSVVLVEDGAEAVRLVESEAFDIVLMDIEMPVMDGFEATRLIRQREEITGRRLPIIALTAHAVSGFRDQCLAAGMDGHVSKPIQPAQLFALIQEVSGSIARA